jgi:branched-subunit amino acid aminotransferase/4-amino-4-deoxychorismate lyase
MIHHIKQQGITVVEFEMTTDWLLKADEVFLTNSISWMRWVREIGDATYGCAIAHQIYSSFRSTF